MLDIRFELVPDTKSKVDASKYFEIVPKQGALPSGGDRNAGATSVTVRASITIFINEFIFLQRLFLNQPLKFIFVKRKLSLLA